MATDWQAMHGQLLDSLADRAASIKSQWATWNPYRQATRELCDAIDHGLLSLEVGGAGVHWGVWEVGRAGDWSWAMQ